MTKNIFIAEYGIGGRALAGLMLAFVSTAALAGDNFQVDINGNTTVNWNTVVWFNSTSSDPNRTANALFPGFPGDGNESPLGSDNALINFNTTAAATQTPQMNLAGLSLTLETLTLTEDAVANHNADGNLISVGSTGVLTIKSLNYTPGGREIDLINVNLSDVSDGSALLINADSTLDIGGSTADRNTVAGSIIGATTGVDGVTISGDSSVTFRNYQITGAITNASTAGTHRFGFDASGGAVVHNVGTFNQLTGGSNVHFYRQSGTNSVTVNVGTINLDSGASNFRIGSASRADNTGAVAVNLNAMVDFTTTGVGSKTFTIAGNYSGVVNLNSGLKQNETSTADVLILAGDGVLNVNSQLLNEAGNPRNNAIRIDGSRSLEVIFNNPTHFGAAQIDARTGSMLSFNYDVFSLGYPGGGFTNVNGTSIADNSGGIAINFNSVQTGFVDPIDGTGMPLRARRYNALSGNLTNAVYAGVGQNIIFSEDGILGPVTGGVAPTRAELGGAAILWQALTANDQVVTNIGDDGAGIFKGVAFSPILHNGGQSNDPDDSLPGFFGSLSAKVGADLEVLVGSETRITRNLAGTTTTVASLNADTGVVNMRGAKELWLEGITTTGAWSGTATTLNRIGDDGVISGVNSQNFNVLRLGGTDAIKTGQTVNVTHGRAILEDAAAVNQGGVLNIGQGALLDLAVSNNGNLTRGDVTITAGGGILWNSAQGFALNAASVWNVTPGTILVFDGDNSLANPVLQGAATGTNPNLTQLMDVVIQDADADVFSGDTLKLGEGRRLTGFASGNADLQAASTGIEALPGVGQIIIAAPVTLGGTVRTLDINTSVNLPTTDLQIGAMGTFQTVVGSTSLNTNRETVNQGGIVRLDGVNLLKNLIVVNGRLILGDNSTPGSATITGDLVYNSATGNGNQQINSGDVHVLGNVAINADGIDPTLSGSPVSLAQLFINADSTSPGGVDNVNELQARFKDGTFAAGSDGIRIHDFGMLQLEISEDVVNGLPTDINQRITLANTNSTSFNGGRNLIITMQGTTTGGSNIVNLNDIQMNAGSTLRINESGSADARAALTLRGDATVSEANLTGFSADDFDLLSVKSSVGGEARTLFVGHLGDAEDTAFNTRLRGQATSDVTFDIVNGTLTYDFSDVNVLMDGKAIIRESGQLSFEAVSETSPTYDVNNAIVIDSPLASRRAALRTARSVGSAAGTYGVNFNNVILTEGSLLVVNENTGTTGTRVALTLNGDGTVGEYDGNSQSGDDFDLLAVKSNLDGAARTLFVGTTGDLVNDISFTSSLRGSATADITFDIVNGTLTVLIGSGGDIQGNAIVRIGQSLVINGGAETLGNLAVFGAVDFAAGGSLVVTGALSGNGSINGSVTLEGSLSPGASPGVISVQDLTLAADSVVNFELADPFNIDPSDRIDVAGLLDITSGPIQLNILELPGMAEGDYVLFNYGSFLGDVANFLLGTNSTLFDVSQMTVINDSANNRILLSISTAIPEPGSAAMVLILLMAGASRRCRMSPSSVCA